MSFLIGVVYILLAGAIFWGIASFAAVFAKERKRKRAVKRIVFVACFASLAADHYAGKLYFYYVCESKSGIFVDHQIALDPSLFDSQGDLIVEKSDYLPGFYDRVDRRYAESTLDVPFHIQRYEYELYDVERESVASKYVGYRYRGGYLYRTLLSGRSFVCDKTLKEFYKKSVISKDGVR